jgi:RNA-directed DNA polymerase
MNSLRAPIKTVEIKSIKHLEVVLGTKIGELEKIIREKESYYYSTRKPKLDKKGDVRRDAQGNEMFRILHPSKGRLKQIQDIIRRRILSKIVLPSNIKGGVKHSDNIANARVHLGKKYKFKTDMKNYFPSISYLKVFEMFLQNGFSSKVSTILTHLTTHKFALPQGTPTSTHIANLVFVPADLLIAEFCNRENIIYTRFIDDLAFSSHFDFRQKCIHLVKFILDAGFSISYKKTMFKAGSMEITGVTTKQNVLDVPEFFKFLMLDKSIAMERTQGRENYYSRVRKKGCS